MTFQLGTISTGTLRTQDLLPTFVNTLLGIDNANDGQTHGYQFTYQNAWDSDYDADSYWNSSYPTEDLEIVSNLLVDLCPPFVYFGTLEGDGSDFGFWVDHGEVLEVMLTAEENEEGDAWLTDNGLLAHDGHDATYMDRERNVIWSTGLTSLF